MVDGVIYMTWLRGNYKDGRWVHVCLMMLYIDV